jgi:hypothetical protein
MSASGYGDYAWRSAGTDAYNSGGVGTAVAGSGDYSMGAGAAADGSANGTSVYGGGYGAAGRQTQRAPDACFRPYRVAADRTG